MGLLIYSMGDKREKRMVIERKRMKNRKEQVIEKKKRKSTSEQVIEKKQKSTGEQVIEKKRRSICEQGIVEEQESEIKQVHLPVEFMERMERMLGVEYKAFFESYQKEAVRGLRVNSLKGSKEAFLEKNVFTLTPVLWEQNGFTYLAEEHPGKHPYHEAGVYYIQEPSAMVVAVLAAPRPGEKVLDLCAAPGGKTTHLASQMKGQGLLVANEIHPARAKILSQNVERMGIRNAVVTNEDPASLTEYFSEFFDRIVVDAPCSGEGMFRKDEMACFEWSPQNVLLCAMRQSEILEHAAKMLKPGGRLAYSTCTFAPEEDEGTVLRFLEKHPEFVIDLEIDYEKYYQMGFSQGYSEWIGDSTKAVANTIRIFPHKVEGEGHYIAVFRKKENRPEIYDYQESDQNSNRNKDDQSDNRNDNSSNKNNRNKNDRNDNNRYENDRNKNDRNDNNRNENDRNKNDRNDNNRNENSRNKNENKNDRMKMDRNKKKRFGDNNITIQNEKKQLADWEQFQKEMGFSLQQGVYQFFGSELYLVPEEMVCMDGMKVLRAGLHLGTLKTNRFEPSHALALALSPSDTPYVISFDRDSKEIISYLKGEMIFLEGQGKMGWHLVCVDGYSIGWGKVSQNGMKNHYPKGLRWM